MSDIWPTRNYDLDTAADIIRKHIALTGDQTLGIFEVNMDGEDDQDVKIADWILELAECFYQLYGREQGDFVTKMVVSQCITNGHSIH